MVKELIILCILLITDVSWWRWAGRRARLLPYGNLWNILLALFMSAQVFYILTNILGAFDFYVSDPWPRGFAVTAYIWNLLILPTAVGCFAIEFVIKRAGKTSKREDVASTAPAESAGTALVTRRQVLSAAAIALPPVVTAVAAGHAMGQTGEFRVRRVELNIPQLPPDLDGVTIAHVTDLHLGRFVPTSLIGPVADAVNAMSCDIVAFTGDLLDVTLPYPPTGMEFLKRLRPANRLVMIEGNHDVMYNAERFEGELRSAGFPLLLDEAMTIQLPGRATPLQFLGMSWGELLLGNQLHKIGRARKFHFRETGDAQRADSIRRLAALRDPKAFPILLAHHPHAFDPAAAAGLPLVLSGHTHGGQLMLTPQIGVGPLRFRYWSGLYQKPGSQLFVSNGIGSWFPLRVNAPAEIVHLTLRAAARI